MRFNRVTFRRGGERVVVARDCLLSLNEQFDDAKWATSARVELFHLCVVNARRQ